MGGGQDFSGVEDVFESIKSDDGAPSDVVSPASSPKTPVPDRTRATAQMREETQRRGRRRPTARVGRFPGSKNKPGPLDKISGMIPSSLKDEYIDWALDDRCSINELLERALVEFYQRHRSNKT